MNESANFRLEAQTAPVELLDALLVTFEQAWQHSEERGPSIHAVLEPYQDLPLDVRRNLLCELILVDQEYRWRANYRGQHLSDRIGSRPRWRTYESLYAELGDIANLSPAAIGEEYRVRQLWGDKPTHDAFLACYPVHVGALVACVQEIDRQIAADQNARESDMLVSPHKLAVPPCEFAFSDFLLQKHLGTGGIGKVYRAWQQSAQRIVAVKTIRKQHRNNPVALASLVRELECLVEIVHPGIVRVHGLGGYPGGGYFLVLDYVDGPDFQTVIDQEFVTLEEAVRVSLSVADAIGFAHQKGILHCDLKPGNVLRSENGKILVTDFGFGQHVLSQAGRSLERLGGTWAYAAPELLLPEFGKLSVVSDVFSMGALLYSLLTGEAPRAMYDDSKSAEELREILRGTIRQPSELRADIPKSLDAIVMRCLAVDPAERFPSVGQFAEALAAWNS